MKKITTYLMAFAALVAVAVSCVKEDLYEKGAPDLEGCFGVYFPSQEITEETQIFAPEEELAAAITIKRLNNKGQTTVPLKITSSHDEIFEVPELVFADGQTETQLVVSFPKAAANPGVTYKLSLEILGDEFVYKYGEHPTAVEFSCLVEKWVKIKADDGSDDFAEVTDPLLEWWFGVPTGVYEMELYRSEVNPNRYRLVNYFPTIGEKTILGDYKLNQYSDYSSAGKHFEFEYIPKGTVLQKGRSNEFTVDTEDYVDFDNAVPTHIQDVRPGGYGQFYYFPARAFEDWPEMADNKVLQWQKVKVYDKVTGEVLKDEQGEEVYETIPAVVQLRPYVCVAMNGGYPTFGPVDYQIIIFPGAKLADISVKVQAARGQDEDGKVPVSFKIGAQATKVYYDIFKGNLAEALVSVHVSEMSAKIKKGDVSDLGQITEDCTLLVEMEEAGEYTLVAVSAALSADEADAYDFVSFGVKDDDGTGDTDLSLELIATDKNSEEYTSKDALEFLITGTSIKDFRYDFFKTSHLLGATDEQLMQLLHKNDDKLDQAELDAAIKAINGNGFSGVFTDLAAGTNYTLVVCTYNGFEEIITKVSASTKGTYNPINDLDLSYLDLEPISTLPTDEWAFLARTLDVTKKAHTDYPGKEFFKPSRELLSENITASVESIASEDAEGNPISLPRVVLDNIYKEHSDIQGMSSKTYFSADQYGFLWLTDEYKLFTAQVSLTESTTALATLSPLHSGCGGFSRYGDELVGGVIANTDGNAIAFCDNPTSYSTAYLAQDNCFGSFYGFALEVYGSEGRLYDLAWYADPIFVNPDVFKVSDDKESDEPAAGNTKANSGLKMIGRPNSVETQAGSILSAKENALPLSLKYHVALNAMTSDSSADFTSEVVEYREIFNELKPVYKEVSPIQMY